MACAQTIPPQNLVARVLYYGLQPAIFVGCYRCVAVPAHQSNPLCRLCFGGAIGFGRVGASVSGQSQWRLNGKQKVL